MRHRPSAAGIREPLTPTDIEARRAGEGRRSELAGQGALTLEPLGSCARRLTAERTMKSPGMMIHFNVVRWISRPANQTGSMDMDNRISARTSLRLSGWLLLVGQLLYIVVTQFHADGDATNHAAVFAEYAGNGIWTAVHLGQFASM